MQNNSAENEIPPPFQTGHIDTDIHDYYEFIRHSEIPVLFIGETGHVIFANKAFHSRYQYPEDFISASPAIGEIICPCDPQEDGSDASGGIYDAFRPGTFIRASVTDSRGTAVPSLVSVSDIPGSPLLAATIYPGSHVSPSPADLHEVVPPAGDDLGIPFEIFDAYPHAVIVLSDTACRYYNTAARKLLGKNAFLKSGLPKIRLVDNDFSELVNTLKCNAGSLPPDSRMIEDQLRISRTRSVDVEILLVPLPDNSRNILVIFRDITCKKHAESELLKRNSQLLMINEVMKVANSVYTLDEMLEEILQTVIREMNFDLGWIYLRDTDAKWATIVASSGVPERFIETRMRQNVLDYPFNLVFFAMQQHYVDNLPNHPPGPIDSKVLEEIDALSYAGIPLISDSVVVGALYIGRRSCDSFSTFEKKTLEMIGSEIGSTILRGILQDRLEDAYSDASLYLDIMLHDIKNANAAVLGYSRRLMEHIGEEGSRYSTKVQWHTHHITDILNNVTTIRRITDESTEMTSINLDALISAEISQYPETDISFMRTGCTVWADSLLSVVFTNLIRNSIKYGGPGVHIWISSEETGHEVTVSVEDDGPGLSDDKKMQLFSLFQESTTERGGRGLGLYITRLLIRRYGGKIRPGDRMPGRPDKGLSIRFTLRLAEETEDDAEILY
ncbi:GAF domain-containing sensor histidine kinase [Methanogenium sp. MK-MG]|uniref:GAF domain-containing sensor histidine kinase n=1 Tax=Methanogenium sp. MK-MG TaxID=2599926 RepID=UPI0013ED2B16|nr:GAF domain-containing sensor histidine kinase [Methanogenium sp. MK-MG]KAF1074668.1 Adaptive-response sensory-kinase SasA [Methanogenium sp. MK-MG]